MSVKRNRIWLNTDKGSSGSMSWFVSVEDRGTAIYPQVWSEVEIRDCSRAICLDFDYGNAKEYKERLKKISKMISELQDLKDRLIAAKEETE